jgi:hypothetical protein
VVVLLHVLLRVELEDAGLLLSGVAGLRFASGLVA